MSTARVTKQMSHQLINFAKKLEISYHFWDPLAVSAWYVCFLPALHGHPFVYFPLMYACVHICFKKSYAHYQFFYIAYTPLCIYAYTQ